MTLNSATEFILIVDDNSTNLSVLKEALKSVGLRVRLAVDGESAIKQAQQELPLLILLDVEMPGINGFETCTLLKADPLTQDIPIIFMTALSDTANKVKGLSLGAVDYITKPFEKEEVLARVNVQLKLRELTKNLAEKNTQLLELTEDLEQIVTERTADLQKAQVKIVQQEKLSMLGQLVAGVAHEVNNPIGCLISNLAPAYEYAKSLSQALKLYQKYCPEILELQEELEELDIEFVLEDLPKLLDSMKLSTQRIKEISISLRNFSRLDADTKVLANLHLGLDSTLVILRHRLKALGSRPEIVVVKQYGDLPEVECYPGQINQVFMNLLANAIDAIEEKLEKSGKDFQPTIKVITEQPDEQRVIIRIVDNGKGINNDIRERILQPLFTTKPINKGTGLGLSIAHQIIVDKHGGKLSFISLPEQGTEFMIELPLGK
ncbi:histidine kinase,Response regulator receiver domain protein,histidine kinase [Nostoc sp. PCC 7524]|uniref:hybrid sensor histidine kinase/response regulator n=1 Tax=Nostoc sp. (strain ATCC 29411 / PCC 7524) TaxID=28072 RepID=UPI00029F21F5|nr:response regulator [Nostoc sp. PCC 7524]AFY47794.1 histidine kinase,Response regulator receiver domain protein,histidine kinase [Nostoc sp. PCC 7524]